MLVTDFQNSPLITARYLVFKHTSERRGRPATLIITVASATPVLNTTSERRGRAIPSKSDNKVAEFFFNFGMKTKSERESHFEQFFLFFHGHFWLFTPTFLRFFYFFHALFYSKKLSSTSTFFGDFHG